MAVDGELIFSTKIDADGFIKGTDKLSSKAVELKYKISATEREVENLTKELEKMANTNVKSKTVENLEKQVVKAKSNLNSLYAKADRIGDTKKAELTNMGLDTKYLDDMLGRDESWQKIQQKIADAEAELNRYERELKNVQTVESKVSGANTAEYAQKKQKIEDLNGKIGVYKAKLNEVQAEEKDTSKQTADVTSYFKRLGAALKTTASNIGKITKKATVATFKKIGSAIKGMFTHTKKANGQMGILAKSLQRIKQALAGLLLYKVLQGGLNSLKEGIDGLAKVSPNVNKSLSALMTSLTYLKNSLASAFAPILTVITPIITGFMDTLSEVTNKVGQFIATLTGQSTYVQAIKVQEDYAESLDDTTSATDNNTKATEKNEKALLGYDELNVMQQDSSVNVSDDTDVTKDYYKTVPITMNNFAEQLKKAFSSQDFSGIGQLVADKLNKSLKKIKWSNIRKTAKSWASNISDTLNGFVKKADWNLIGKTIGNGIMTAVDFAYAFLTKFNFQKFGQGLAQSLNGIIKSIDWKKIGATFGAVIQSVISTGFGFVKKFDWVGLGKALSKSINNFFKKIDWKQAGQAISTGVKGAFSTISSALKSVDWKQIGKDIGDFFANIDWKGILKKAADTIVLSLEALINFTSFKPLTDFYNNFLKPLGIWVFGTGLPSFVSCIKDMVANIDWDIITTSLNNLWTPLSNFTENVGTGLLWFFDNVLTPLVDWTINDILPAFLDAVGEALSAINTATETFQPLWQWLWDNFLLPVGTWTGGMMAQIIDGITNALIKFSDWANDNQQNMSLISSIILGFFSGIIAYYTAKGLITAIKRIREAIAVMGSMTLTAGMKTAFAAAAIGILAAGIFYLAQNWDKMEPAERVITILGALAAAATAAAIAIALFHTAWSVGIAAAAIAGGIALLGITYAFTNGSTDTADSAYDSANDFYSSYDFSGNNYSFPKLATGAYVPANYGEFLAVLGDNKREAEIVAPESKLEEAVIKAISKLDMGGGDINITLQVGEDVIGTTTVKWNERYKKRHGKSAFA